MVEWLLFILTWVGPGELTVVAHPQPDHISCLRAAIRVKAPSVGVCERRPSA